MRQISFSSDGSPVSAAYDVVMLGDAGWETVSSSGHLRFQIDKEKKVKFAHGK